MGEIEVQHYLSRARDFLKGMECLEREDLYVLNEEFVKFRYSLALIGIHCAISYSDALRSGMGRERLSSDDHGNAVNDLESLLKTQSVEDRKGIGHLRRLLGKKGKVAYHPVMVGEAYIEDIVKHTGRFAEWAEDTGRKLRIEGW